MTSEECYRQLREMLPESVKVADFTPEEAGDSDEVTAQSIEAQRRVTITFTPTVHFIDENMKSTYDDFDGDLLSLAEWVQGKDKADG